MPEEKVELTIVMPCLNEAQTLERCIKKARGWCQHHNVSHEIIVGDNGSTDDSRAIARAHGARVIEIAAKGYGHALRGAIAAARGQYIIMGDADDSYDFSDLSLFYAKLREGYDLVMGNRFAGGIKHGAMPKLHRYLGNPVLTAIGRLLFSSKIRDFHCGLRGFAKRSVEMMNLRTTGMEFASEMVIKATLMNMLICEVPTILHPDGRNRPPHLRSWRDGWRHLRFMLLYSPRWLFFYPGLIMMALGLLVSGRLLYGPWSLGSITFDIHSLLFASMTLLMGYQSIFFSVFSRVYAINAGLYPPLSRLSRLPDKINLEGGIIVALLLISTGLGGGLYSLKYWSDYSSFGELDPRKSMRLVIPAVTAIILGIQTFMGSFFISTLNLKKVEE